MVNEDSSINTSAEEYYFKIIRKIYKSNNEEVWSEKFDKYQKNGLYKTEAEENADK